jgi:UDP-N-acetylmuramate--alanine ligase
MSSLAGLILALGYKVVGSQQSETDNLKQPRLVQQLISSGAVIYFGHSPAWIQPDTALVIYSSAVPDDNVELVAARARSLPTIKRATLLGYLMRMHQMSIAVAGTAGKTTTSAMISHIFLSLNQAPTFSIGSPFVGRPEMNYYLGDGSLFIAEADEFDRSFLELSYDIAVITELFHADHADYYKDLDDLMGAFREFVLGLPESGTMIFNQDSQSARHVRELCRRKAVSYGISTESSHLISNCKLGASTSFTLLEQDSGTSVEIVLALPGFHNVYNAAAALLAASCTGKVNLLQAAIAIRDYRGTERRLQFKGMTAFGAFVYDDYAHNPVQISASLLGLQQLHPKAKVWCIFQPRQFRRMIMLLSEFPGAFATANRLLLLDISLGIGDTKELSASINSKMIADYMQRNSINCSYCDSHASVLSALRAEVGALDVIVTMGTGRLAEFAQEIVDM